MNKSGSLSRPQYVVYDADTLFDVILVIIHKHNYIIYKLQ